mmetsp:Transcript_24594/g.37080  ORF Transcript_24594/g.37080 Transcript_24594/m.37080 type:complete len:495 (+) Transcript_24594:75-1559(+)
MTRRSIFRLAAAIAVVTTTLSSSFISASAADFELPLFNPKEIIDTDTPNESFIGPNCAAHTNCTECGGALSALCHWCAKNNKCHAKGDPFGCLIGASCDAPPPTPKPTKPPTPPAKKCIDFKDCQSCANSSWECHWCPQDNDGTCHAKGSWSGCASGADCFAIDRCQRLEPERVYHGGTFSKASFEGVGPVATTVLAVIMGLVLCCATCCFAGATFVKGAVDDLVRPVDMVYEDDGMSGQYYDDDNQLELEAPLLLENGSAGETDGEAIADANRRSNSLTRSEQVSVTQLSAMSVTTNRRPPKKKSSIRRMYGVCQVVYLVTIFFTVTLFIVGMSYAPRQPQYNVCTNQLGWKSIIEGMASLKVSASFDLLISVYNPNRVEVDLKNGAGQFHYDGEYIGSFEIPEGKIAEEAISDIIVKVTFTPDKWQALSLTSEYYRGTLRFIVGGHAHVSVPALGNYSFEAKFDDIEVNTNDPSLDDTHLCACPGWKKPGHH